MSLKNKLLIGTTLLASLFGREAKAEEAIRLKQPLAIERTLEEKIPKPKIEINFNYKTESEQKGIDYQASDTILWASSEYPLWRESDVPELNETEKNQVKNIIKDIKDQTINSYQELVEAGKNLSLENQKLDLLATIGGIFKVFMYANSDSEVASQEEYFYGLQNSISSYTQNGLGVCRHGASNLEQLANDLGIKSAAVSGLSGNGVGHAYVISKTENGAAIIDYDDILITNTKNIEKTLEAYQKHRGTTTFQHLFFEDAEFKHRLITKDGRNFLNFIGYDESPESLKDVLISGIDPEPDARIAFNLEDYLSSIEFNYFGFFTKTGEIRGGANSPLDKATLFQAGFKKKFLTPDINNKYLNFIFGNKIIELDGSFIYGEIFQDTKVEDRGIQGINGNLVVATNNEKGFNLSSRIAGNFINTKDSTLFHDFILGGGVSYKVAVKNINIEPYVVPQFSFFPKDIGTYKFAPKLSELTGGTNIDIKFNDVNFSIDPYYLWRIWEQGFGGNIKFGSKDFGINAKGDATWSNYEFNPDKINLKIGPYLNLGKLHIGIDYELKRTNYDKEIENQHLFGLRGNVKF